MKLKNIICNWVFEFYLLKVWLLYNWKHNFYSMHNGSISSNFFGGRKNYNFSTNCFYLAHITRINVLVKLELWYLLTKKLKHLNDYFKQPIAISSDFLKTSANLNDKINFFVNFKMKTRKANLNANIISWHGTLNCFTSDHHTLYPIQSQTFLMNVLIMTYSRSLLRAIWEVI